MEGWGGGVAGTHSLSPEFPEAAVGLQVLGRPHRSLSALRVCIRVNWGVAAGRAVISFFKRRLKKKKNIIQTSDGRLVSSDYTFAETPTGAE